MSDIGLYDISKEADFVGIYDENMNEDPTYDPNSKDEKALFMQFVEYILLKLTFTTTEVQQYENLFRFSAVYHLTNAIRLPDERLDKTSYQRLQQRLALQQKLVKKHLEKKVDIRKNIAYLKIATFLIPFFINLKRRNKIPNLNRLLQPYSGKNVSICMYPDCPKLIIKNLLLFYIYVFGSNKQLIMVSLRMKSGLYHFYLNLHD